MTGPLERTQAIRGHILRMSYTARAAHLGSALSCVEILDSVLACSNVRPDSAADPDRDRIIVSKGHAAMAYYAALTVHGLIPRDWIDSYLVNGSCLWGHVTRHAEAPAIDYSTGSLGHGLGLGAGHAYGYRLKRVASRIFCVLSDGECNEGSIWEAALFAGHHRLSRLVAIIDYNKIQSLDHCKKVLDPEPFLGKWQSFGWDCVEVDGHDSEALVAAIGTITGSPRMILAHTVKGKGIPRIENTVRSHYEPATEKDLQAWEASIAKSSG